jgi:ppGpp synthetase/RelA/SpoT-type nucleotidyltranferase
MEQTIKEVQQFKSNYEAQYRKLLSDVRAVFQEIDDDARARNKIKEVYGRAKKQNGDEFKSVVKIAQKLEIWRIEDPNTKVNDIHDIIGITVVVFYADYIRQLIEIALPMLADEGLYPVTDRRENPSYHRDFGYHATHLIIVSRHPSHQDLQIEVQFKTMLHDAWGAKTHDLTYKPKGLVNPKIKRLMESLGDSLQAIEVQSENLRDMIAEQGSVDADRRRLILTQMAEGMHRRLTTDRALGASQIFEKIKNNIDHLSKCRLDDKQMATVRAEIDANNEIVSEIGPAKLLLNVWLACIRLNDDLNHIAKLNIGNVQANIRKTQKGLSYLWAAMLNYFMEDLERAIELTREGLQASDTDNATREKLTNNLCYFLVESCSENPTDLAARKQEASTLREKLRPEVISKDLLPVATFTCGFFEIMFGETEDQILKGIGQCEAAYGPGDRKPDAFVSLMLEDCRRVGWRRILNLDALRKSLAKRGA